GPRSVGGPIEDFAWGAAKVRSADRHGIVGRDTARSVHGTVGRTARPPSTRPWVGGQRTSSTRPWTDSARRLHARGRTARASSTRPWRTAHVVYTPMGGTPCPVQRDRNEVVGRHRPIGVRREDSEDVARWADRTFGEAREAKRRDVEGRFAVD